MKKPKEPAGPHLLICLLLIASVAVIYWHVAGFGFVDYDDDVYVWGHPNVLAGLNAKTVRWAFTTDQAANWHPITWLSLMADAQITEAAGLPDVDGKPSAHVFHLTSILLHLANSLLLYLLLFRMTGRAWRSGLVALLFAAHPLHVESVAWVAERKDVLSTLFWLLTMLAYVSWTRRRGAGRYALMIGLFALGLMCKPMLVTLPIVLLLVDYWPLGRQIRRSLVEKLPLLAMSAASCAVTYYVQHSAGAVTTLDYIPFGQRAANALVQYVAYIAKMVVPTRLAAIYPHPGGSLPIWQVIGSAALFAAACWLAIRAAKSRPYLALGWFWYVVTLLPVIGLVQVGDQAAADRYTYVPLIGLFIAIAWGVPDLWPGTTKGKHGKPAEKPNVALGICGAAAVLALTIGARAQTRHWSDTVSLFEHAALVTSGNYVAHFNLGKAMIDSDRNEEAAEHYRECVRLRPKDGEAHLNLGVALNKIGDLPDAVREYRAAARLMPHVGVIHNNIGCALDSMGDKSGSEKEFVTAARLDPKDPQAPDNLGILYAQRGDFHKAVDQFRRAHELAPDDALIEEKLQRAMADQTRTK